MELYISSVVILTYLTFALNADRLNPFKKPVSIVGRRRWRYGRRMGFAAGASTLAAILLHGVMNLQVFVAMAVSFCVFALLWWMLSAQYRGVLI